MKRFLTIIAVILVIALVVFGVHSCKKSKPDTNVSDNPTEGIVGMTPIEDGETSTDTPSKTPDEDLANASDEEVIEKHENDLEKKLDNTKTFTGTGIYHGKADSTSVEITMDSVQPFLISAKLSPEIAEKFSSYELTEESIISFEYKIVDEQYVITKILK